MGLFSRKINLGASGIFKGATDYHCHVLPGVDDGFKNMEDSLAALSEYEKLGFTDVWLTPHIMEDIPNTPEELKARFDELCASYTGTVKLHLAAENMLDGLFSERLEAGNVLPIMGKWLLVETSYYNPPMDMVSMLKKVASAGYFPILAHPERYIYMSRKQYESLHADGIKFQLNIGSLLGYYGPDAKAKAEWMLKSEYYSFVGTDLHSLPLLEFIRERKLSKDLYEKLARLLS